MQRSRTESGEQPRKRTRLIAGCHACRSSHRKCDTNTPCHSCQQSKLECVRDFKYKFRHLISSTRNWDVAFPERQLWTSPSGPFHFCDQTRSIGRRYDASTSPRRSASPVLENRRHSHPLTESPQRSSDTTPDAVTDIDMYCDDGISPSGNMVAVRAECLSSPWTLSTAPFSPREALLMRNFTEEMASWVDVADVKRHFELEVPRRALHNPILRYAIFALSSRHLSRTRGGGETEALHYHTGCLQHLISALSGSEEADDEILASAAILRLFEEMDAEDCQRQLSANTRLLNSIPDFRFSGGLREATAWLCLRQDIYVSLITQQPLRTNLAKFASSVVFHEDDDFAWANRMVFLLAKVLSYAFCEGPFATTDDTWRSIDEEVDGWEMNKPSSFNPIHSVPRGRENDHRLPQNWMLSAIHVLGLQYYHIAKIILALSTQSTVSNAYEHLERGRTIERCVTHHLLIVLGLAESNIKAENALFTARHCLSVWGSVLRHRLDQDAATAILTTTERITGWSTTWLVASLEEKWDSYRDDD
ncbi:hypothetical protein BDV34DRAFT_127537 [Aspergillus parasiticus]|uniref:Zn(2)-C6 fungal-type domain-containing protein n=1 Tax=Aspergillus parasiticus TaxID=5067 RepID=A0A5N6DF23_ASPPA|nr:hypothetical protein BDV34DRAFT_127537 [Aspergillus parasiticus]